MTKANNKLSSGPGIKHLSGKMVWLVAAVAVGLLGATGFGLVALGNDSEDTGLDIPEDIFELVTEQEGLTITARVIDTYSSGWARDAHWKYMIIDVGENCDRASFSNHPPNYPGIHYSNQLVLPGPSDRQTAYRNKWICFEAVSGNLTGHILHDIDTGNPVVSVKRMTILSGRGSYLQASASESVTYRVGRVQAAETGVSVLGEPSYSWLQAGTDCEQMFQGNYIASHYYNGRYVTAPLQFEEITVGSRATVVTHLEDFADFIYCFEATDADGNRTYVQATPDRELIVYRGSPRPFWTYDGGEPEAIHFRLLNTSGYVEWAIAWQGLDGDDWFDEGDSENCPTADYSLGDWSLLERPGHKYRAGGFNDNPVWGQDYWQPEGVAPPIYMLGYLVYEAPSYYCVRAIDQLGNHYYRFIPDRWRDE